MKNAKFLEFWNKSVKPLLDRELANDKRIYATYDSNKNSEVPHNVDFRYESIRDGIKKDFMLQVNGLLDRHKICAFRLPVQTIDLLKKKAVAVRKPYNVFVGELLATAARQA